MKNIGKSMANLSLIKHLRRSEDDLVLRQLQAAGITAQEYAAIGTDMRLLRHVKQTIVNPPRKSPMASIGA